MKNFSKIQNPEISTNFSKLMFEKQFEYIKIFAKIKKN